MNARNMDQSTERHSSKGFERTLAPRLASAVLALTSLVGGIAACVPQNQAELDQLRAQLKAAQDENAMLRAQQGPGAQPAATAAPAAAEPAPASTNAAAAPPASATPPFEEAWKAFEAEKRDAEWALKREKGVLDAAKEHIAKYGAAINSIRCKTTVCALVIDVPEKPKAPYVEFSNPWAETQMSVAEKPIYAKQTRYTYLLHRHTKDYPSFAEQRVDPLALAKSQQKASAAAPAAAASPPTPPTSAAQAAAKPAPAAKPAAPPAYPPAPSATVQPVAAPAGQPPVAK
jgi:hypothetical protein